MVTHKQAQKRAEEFGDEITVNQYMNGEVAKTDQKEPWPRGWWRFPLLPYIRTRKAGLQNTSSFCFQWMFFTLWTIDSIALSIEIKLEESFFVKCHLPYFLIMVSVPVFPVFFLQRFWRKSTMTKLGGRMFQ